MTDDERWGISVHEASHFVAAYRLMDQRPALSIRKTQAHLGVAVGVTGHVNFGERDPDSRDPMWPVAMADPQLRAAVERYVIFCEAGRIAQTMVAPVVGHIAAAPEPDAALRAYVELHPRERELLARAESDPPPDPDELLVGDEAAAFEVTYRMAGIEAAGAYQAWLRVEARRFVIHHVREIVAVATVLVAKTFLSGDAAAAIVDATRKEYVLPSIAASASPPERSTP